MKHAGKIALLVAVIGAAASTLILFGARLGLWDPITGFGFYRNYFNFIAMIGFCRKVSSSGRRYRGMIGAACNV